MSITPEQSQQIGNLVKTTPSIQPMVSTPQSGDWYSTLKSGGFNPLTSGKSTTPNVNELPGLNTLEGVKNSIVGRFAQNYWNILKNSNQELQNTFTKPEANIVQEPGKFLKQGGEKILGGTGAIWQDIFAPLSAGVETAIPSGSLGGGVGESIAKGAAGGAPFGPMGVAAGAILGMAEHAASTSDFFQKNPQALKDINNALITFGPMLSGLKPAKQGVDLLNTPIQDYPKALMSSYTQPINALAQGIKSKLQKSVGDKMVENEVSDWQKPVQANKAGYNKAREIFNNAQENDHDIAKTLVNNGIKISDNVKNGSYDTLDTVDAMRSDAGQMSKDILRPALEAADPSTQRIQPEELIDAARDKITNSKFITQENKAGLISSLDKAQSALEDKYTSGMQLADLLDEKITRDLNSKYSPVGDIATNNSATINKAIADAARQALDDNAPEGVPVKQFNAELQKQYQAADYLEALNTKKVPKGLISQIGKTTAKVLGATVGAKIGGGIFGGVGGYHLGGMLETMFENMDNPLREYFLNNLKQSNPEVFDQVQTYLTQQGIEQSNRLQLNSGDSSKVPIELGPKKPQDIIGRPVDSNELPPLKDIAEGTNRSDLGYKRNFESPQQDANFTSLGSPESQIAQNYLKSQVANIASSHNASTPEAIQFQKVFDGTDFSSAATPSDVINTFLENLPSNLKTPERVDFFTNMIKAIDMHMDAYKKFGPPKN